VVAHSTASTRRQRIRSLVDAHPFVTVAAVATAARVAMVAYNVLAHHGYTIPDEQQYLDLSRWMADGLDPRSYANGYGRSLLDAVPVFLWPLTFLTWVFGDGVRLVASLCVAVFGVVTAVATTWLAQPIVARRWAVLAGVVVAIVPSQVLLSSVVLRESLVWAGCAGMAVAVAAANRASTTRALALAGGLAVIAMLTLGWTRDQVLIAASWSLLPGVLLGPSSWRGRRFVGALLLVLFVPMFSNVGPGGADLISTMAPQLGSLRTTLSMNASTAFTPTTLLEEATTTITTPTSVVATGPPSTIVPGVSPPPTSPVPPTSVAPTTTVPPTTTTVPGQSIVRGYGGEVYLVDDSAGASLHALPRGLLAVLLRPYPWESADTVDSSFARIENIGWYVLYAFAALGAVATGWRSRDRLGYPALLFLGITASAAVIQGNLGTAFRHRGELLWVVALFAAIGAASLLERVGHRRDPRIAS
jgi:hypothetical protein